VRCPACHERVIDFGVWGQGLHAFRSIECASCGAWLRPSRRTKVLFFALLLAILPFVIIVDMTLQKMGFADLSMRRLAFGCAAIPAALASAYAIWSTGKYTLHDRPKPIERTGALKSRRADLGRFLLLTATGLGLIAFMFAKGRRDIVLTFDREVVQGQIVRVHEHPSGFQVRYEFTDFSGGLHTGEDEVPLARPPKEGAIDIAYSRRDSSVSRIASQVSTTPISGVVIAVGVLCTAVVQFVRARSGSRQIQS
jgi:hypothetical protein